MDSFVPQPIAGAINDLMEHFHNTFDPSPILGDGARRAFYDHDDDDDGPTSADPPASSSPAKKKPRMMGPPQPEGNRRHGAASPNNNTSNNGEVAIAKSRAMLAANRTKNQRLQVGKARASLLSSRPRSPLWTTTTTSPGGGSPTSGRRGITNRESSTSYDSLESGDVYLSDGDDEDADAYDDDANYDETVPTTTHAHKKKMGPAAKPKKNPASASQVLLSKAASLVAGCGSGGTGGSGSGSSAASLRVDDDERREGGGSGSGSGTTAALLARGLAENPCGTLHGERESAPPSSSSSPVAVIDLSSYDPHGPYDHLLERVAVMTIQMEKMRDEFDKMRTENAVLLENLSMAGDAAAHLNLMDASEDEEDEYDDNQEAGHRHRRHRLRMDPTGYEDYQGGMEPEAEYYPVVHRRPFP